MITPHDVVLNPSTLDMLKACEAVTHAQTWASYSAVYRLYSFPMQNLFDFTLAPLQTRYLCVFSTLT